MARYINLGSQPIAHAIGSAPGLPWTRYDSAPGDVVEGPAGYLRSFTDAGYTLVTPEIQAMLDEDAARVLAKETESAKAPESAPEPVTEPVLAVESAPEPVQVDNSQRGKRRGRPQ